MSQTKRRKILYIITKSNWGGAQRYVYDLATNLSKDDFEVVVALGGTGEKEASTGKLAEMLHEKGVHVVEIKNFMREISLLRDLKAFFEVLKIIQQEHPDTLHLNSSKALGIGSIAGRIAGVRNIVATVHGWPFKERHRGLVFKTIAYIGSWLTTIFAHKVIVVSHQDREMSHQLPWIQHKTFVIHNGTKPFATFDRETAREKLREQSARAIPNKVWIGTIAELTRNKGLEYAIRACMLLRERAVHFDYVIATSGGEEHIALSKLTAELNLEDTVHIIEFPEARQVLRAFDMFLLPSRKEGLPYMLLEAGITEIPIIATNVGGIPEILEHEHTGLLIEPENPEAIADALMTLVKDEGLRNAYASTIKQRVEHAFSIEKMLEKTAALY